MATDEWFDFRFTLLMDSADWILILTLVVFGFALFWLHSGDWKQPLPRV